MTFRCAPGHLGPGVRNLRQSVPFSREGAASGGLFFTDPDGLRLEPYAPSGIQGEAPVSGAPTCGFS